MSQTIILCEGITDLFFIGHCMDIFFGLEFTEKYNSKKTTKDCKLGDYCKIFQIGGCENLTNQIYIDLLKDNLAEGGKNVVIFDADFAPDATGEKQGTGNNGFKNAKRRLEDIRKNKEVDFDFYLWHDNENDGEVEDLLSLMIPNDKKVIMDCINSHRNCLSTLDVKDILIPDKKNVLNYYLYTLQHEQHNYNNAATWNMNLHEIVQLKKFTDFMCQHFSIRETYRELVR